MDKNTKNIETKIEPLYQYDYVDDVLMLKKAHKYAPLIGSFLINFSNLEHCLDVEIADFLGNQRSHDFGYMVLKNLGFAEKIELFYDLVYTLVCWSEKHKRHKMLQLKKIKKSLDDLCVLRNKIAHAKWYTLDSEGYVRVAIKTDKDNGLVNFKKLRITPITIKRGLREIDSLTYKISDFTEKLQEL